jgi:hypothetical protein
MGILGGLWARGCFLIDGNDIEEASLMSTCHPFFFLPRTWMFLLELCHPPCDHEVGDSHQVK